MNIKQFLLGLGCVAMLFSCKPEDAKPESPINPRVWSPMFQGADNVVLNTYQNGSNYQLAYFSSIYSSAQGMSTLKPDSSYGFMTLMHPPSFANNTIAYISRDSIYIGKLNALENTQNIGSLLDFGGNPFSYRLADMDESDQLIFTNDRNELVIPLESAFSRQFSLLTIRLAGDVADDDDVLVADSEILDINNSLLSVEDSSIYKVHQVDNRFFVSFKNTGLFTVVGTEIIQVLEGTPVLDIFSYGNRIAAAVRTTGELKNRLYFSADNGLSYTTSNLFPALDSIITCGHEFYSDGSEIFSYSTCGDSTLYSHTLEANEIITRKLNQKGIEFFQPKGFVVLSNNLLYCTLQGVFTANRDSVYAIEPEEDENMDN